jgi:two-component system response regulator AtoC
MTNRITVHVPDEKSTPLGRRSERPRRRKIDTAKPDTIILDIRLPDGNGLDFLKQLRASAIETPVIMITAFHDMDTTIKAIKLGALEYITKPIDVDELEKAILRAMRLRGFVKEEAAPAERPVYEKGKLVGSSREMKMALNRMNRSVEPT